MPFKIVRTFENGKFKHWIVPSPWENNNIVKWPKINANKLEKIEHSLPGPDWRKKKCLVKRFNIPTYEAAEYELANMMANTDTDEDTGFKKNTQPSQDALNLNELVEQMLTNKQQEHPPEILKSTLPSEVVDPNHIMFSNENDDCVGTYCLVTENADYVTNNENLNLNKILDGQSYTLENQNKIMEYMIENNKLQKVILENQKKIMHKMASLSIQVDNMLTQFSDHVMRNDTEIVALKDITNKVESAPFNIQPINSIKELDDIEKALADKSARNILKQTYSVVCSGGRGIDCAYTLIDLVFTRDFLCKCSWSGSSRSDGIKISLKCYKNLVSFFWEMIFHWDSKYSIKDNEMFFKNILKNANKRKLAKQERTSTSRKRAKLDNKNKDCDKKKDNTENKNKNKEKADTEIEETVNSIDSIDNIDDKEDQEQENFKNMERVQKGPDYIKMHQNENMAVAHHVVESEEESESLC